MMQKDENLINFLCIFVSDCAVLSSQAQGFHWNSVGPDFFDVHDFFHEVYKELSETIDTFAERIRALEGMAPLDLFQAAEMTVLPKAAYSSLIQGSEAVQFYLHQGIRMVDSAKKLCKMCELGGDATTRDMLLDFLEEQEKRNWMARSFLS